MKEIWKDIPGYIGFYQISNLGRVKSVDRILKKGKYKFLRKGHIKSLNKQFGYMYVHLCKNSRFTSFRVHRLVAIAFLKNKNNYRTVNHKNSRRDDNRVENLEWCSHKQNFEHAINNGKMKHMYGERNHLSKLSEKQVIKIYRLANMKNANIKSIAEKYKCTRRNIYDIKNKITWKRLLERY